MIRKYNTKENNLCQYAKIAWLINEEEGTTLTDMDIYDNMHRYNLIRLVPIENIHEWSNKTHGKIRLNSTEYIIYDI